MKKKYLQWMVICAMAVALFASAGGVMAWSGCASYIVVQWGDTLSGIAALCGTTVEAIQTANPGLGWWLYAGQVLYIPTGYTSAPAYTPAQSTGGTYVVQWGDTIGSIAASTGFSVNDILAVNPQIWNANWIYAGQALNLPGSASVYTPQYSSYYVSNPAPSYSSPYGYLRVTNKKGLLIRTGPGTGNPILESPTASAVYLSTWQYKKSSVTVDPIGFVWAEITFSEPVYGYSTGWILVKDSLGNYYANPPIDQ